MTIICTVPHSAIRYPWATFVFSAPTKFLSCSLKKFLKIRPWGIWSSVTSSIWQICMRTTPQTIPLPPSISPFHRTCWVPSRKICWNLGGDPWKKLISNLRDKKNYVTHYRNLQFYVKQGLRVTKIHRIISFTQSSWLKEWIDVCMRQSQNAKLDFEVDVAKLQANATFGKTMEQARNRHNIRLIANPTKLRKAVSKPSYWLAQIINSNLVIVRAQREKVLLKKPIVVGFCILDLSKLIMYKFFYDYVKPRYGKKCKLLFTDTVSLCLEIKTPNLYRDMNKAMDLFDTTTSSPSIPCIPLETIMSWVRWRARLAPSLSSNSSVSEPKCIACRVETSLRKKWKV